MDYSRTRKIHSPSTIEYSRTRIFTISTLRRRGRNAALARQAAVVVRRLREAVVIGLLFEFYFGSRTDRPHRAAVARGTDDVRLALARSVRLIAVARAVDVAPAARAVLCLK